MNKSPEQWKEQLTDEQYRVCREKGTESPFSGKYNDFTQDGTYACVCCGQRLFDSKTKFNTGCGWPSFWGSVESKAVKHTQDNSFGMRRVEVQCASCGAHLGHVFPDGPEPTGERYCINSVSLAFNARSDSR